MPQRLRIDARLYSPISAYGGPPRNENSRLAYQEQVAHTVFKGETPKAVVFALQYLTQKPLPPEANESLHALYSLRSRLPQTSPEYAFLAKLIQDMDDASGMFSQ